MNNLLIKTARRCQCAGLMILLPLSLIVLSACASSPKVSDALVQSKYADKTPSQAALEVQNKYNQAKQGNYAYFSPQNWRAASDALQDANDLLKKNSNDKEIFKYTYVVEQKLDAARGVSESVQNDLKPVFELKATLQGNEAEKSHGSELKSIFSDLSSLIEDYEKYKMQPKPDTSAKKSIDKDMAELSKDMQSLNIKVVKFNYLEAGKNMLKSIEDLDAKKLAAKSHHQTLQALDEANIFIEKNMYDKNGIAKASAQFRFMVEHLQHVTKAVIDLAKKDKTQFEDVVLQNEMYLHAIGQALHAGDVRDKPLAEQSAALVADVDRLMERQQDKDNMLVKLSEDALAQHQRGNNNASDSQKKKIDTLETELSALQMQRTELQLKVSLLQQKIAELTTDEHLDSSLASEAEAVPVDGFKSADLKPDAQNNEPSEAKIDSVKSADEATGEAVTSKGIAVNE